MKIKLANDENSLYITGLTRGLNTYLNNENEEIVQYNSVSIKIEGTQSNTYELAKDFFENKDLSVIHIYNNNDQLLFTLSGKKVESITQSVDDIRSITYIVIILND